MTGFPFSTAGPPFAVRQHTDHLDLDDILQALYSATMLISGDKNATFTPRAAFDHGWTLTKAESCNNTKNCLD